MSFTSVVKDEVSKLEAIESDNITELSAIIRNGSIINDYITITTENASVARRIFNLIKETYFITPRIIVRKGFNYQKKLIYILEIKDKKDFILNDLCINDNIPKDYLVADDDLIMTYLRGLFLISGSINDPKKSRYHLEFLVDNLEYGNFIVYLLNKFYLNSKIIKRDKKYMVYIKEAEKIGDFLRIIKANNAVLYYEDIRIYRDHKNMTNRLNNCEQANVDKIVNTAYNQIKDIELIESVSIDLLDDKEKEAATYRMKYKDVSLGELSEIISIETGHLITKSGLYHRFKKISNLAEKLRKN